MRWLPPNGTLAKMIRRFGNPPRTAQHGLDQLETSSTAPALVSPDLDLARVRAEATRNGPAAQFLAARVIMDANERSRASPRTSRGIPSQGGPHRLGRASLPGRRNREEHCSLGQSLPQSFLASFLKRASAPNRANNPPHHPQPP